MYLKRQELMALTGYTKRSAVIGWLDRHGWPYATGRLDGWPRVLRRYHDERLMGVDTSRSRNQKAGPNWTVSP